MNHQKVAASLTVRGSFNFTDHLLERALACCDHHVGCKWPRSLIRLRHRQAGGCTRTRICPGARYTAIARSSVAAHHEDLHVDYVAWIRESTFDLNNG